MDHESAGVVGWKDASGEWHDVTIGDEPAASDLEQSPSIRVQVTDADGVDHYFTTSYITDLYDLDAIIDDWAEDYGVEFV